MSALDGKAGFESVVLRMMESLPADRVTKAILFGFMALIPLLIGLLAWIGHASHTRAMALAREVRVFETGEPFRDLRDCLGWQMSLAKRWDDLGTGVKSVNGVKELGVALYDLGPSRKVVISTRRGRPLRDSEIASLALCGLD